MDESRMSGPTLDLGGALRPGGPMNGRPEESVPGRLLDILVETTDLREILETVTELAIDTIPGCESASVTVIREHDPATVASSDRRARAVDEAQYRVGTGPCLLAARTDEIVQVDDVRTAVIPGEWKQVALEAGITATLSMPIASDANVAAGLNLYSGLRAGWSIEAIDAADLLAAYTGDAITLAYRLNRHRPADDADDPGEPPHGSVLPFTRK
jgi:GAF domain-containing protein